MLFRSVLMGKHRPTYTPHVDTGDFVVVVNAEKVQFTGKKWQQKLYRWYTGYQGLKTETAEHRLNRRPELIIEEAVRRMLPKTRLGRVMLDPAGFWIALTDLPLGDAGRAPVRVEEDGPDTGGSGVDGEDVWHGEGIRDRRRGGGGRPLPRRRSGGRARGSRRRTSRNRPCLEWAAARA